MAFRYFHKQAPTYEQLEGRLDKLAIRVFRISPLVGYINRSTPSDVKLLAPLEKSRRLLREAEDGLHYSLIADVAPERETIMRTELGAKLDEIDAQSRKARSGLRTNRLWSVVNNFTGSMRINFYEKVLAFSASFTLVAGSAFGVEQIVTHALPISIGIAAANSIFFALRKSADLFAREYDFAKSRTIFLVNSFGRTAMQFAMLYLGANSLNPALRELFEHIFDIPAMQISGIIGGAYCALVAGMKYLNGLEFTKQHFVSTYFNNLVDPPVYSSWHKSSLPPLKWKSR